MSKPTTFIVVRHEKVDNPLNLFYGVSRDLPNSKQGMEDAKKLGVSLKGIQLGEVVVSTLVRTRMTAERIIKGMGLSTEGTRRSTPHAENRLAIIQDPRLTDVAYPTIEGQTIDSNGLVTLPTGVKVDLDNIDPYADETLEHAGQRFQGGLRDTAMKHPGETVLVVSHGDTIAAGLAKFEEPTQDVPSAHKLIEQGRYPAKGELAVLLVNSEGNLEGEIYRNPEISFIHQLIEGNMQSNKEKE